MATLLDDIQELDPHNESLKALGYETYEQFLGAARAVGPELGNYLGVDLNQLMARLPKSAAAPPEILQLIESSYFSLGVELNHIPALQIAPTVAFPAPALPEKADLRGVMPAIKNQNPRGTCVAFAALAVYQQFLARQGEHQDFSEQFLYWSSKVNDGHPEQEGTYLGIAFPQLELSGCCLGPTWAYNPTPNPANWGQGPPPAAAKAQAPDFKIPNIRVLAPTAVDDLKGELAAGRCVAFSIPVFQSWYKSPDVIQTGNLVLPVPETEKVIGGHAMCLVGYVDLPTAPGLGGGRFIVRNSWGTGWGSESEFGPGYGTVPYSYIDRFGSEAYSIG